MDPFRVYDKSTETGKEKKIFTDLDTIGDISNVMKNNRKTAKFL